MTPEKIVENHKKYVLQSWSKQGNLNPIPVAKADGIYFYDFDGNRYTDCLLYTSPSPRDTR